MMDTIRQKNTGSFYTCDTIANYIVKWAIEGPEVCVLEPSFGDGVFINSAISRYEMLGNRKPKIIGVELQSNPFNLFMQGHSEIMGFQMDFMDYKTNTPINAIIGNPPYISLKKLKEAEREKALNLVSSYGIKMQTSGSLWMPFIIHSTELLAYGGKLGFVLPYEITHVRYAFDLWKYLSDKYGKITVCRICHDFFPNVDVETIILLAENKGEKTNTVFYKVYDTIDDLYNEKPFLDTEIPVEDIINLRKPFERKLIPPKTICTLDLLKNRGKLSPFVQDCKFRIGYVSGNKKYFHLSAEDMLRLNIREETTKKCLVNAKQITANNNIGIETYAISNYSHLFYPTMIGGGESKYISDGEKLGINNGYKCRVRKPWYLTPGLEIPDVILTVFGDVPKLLLNNGDFYVSNSLLSGFSKVKNAKELICRWYNSLTLLSIEITIHSLGGGTLVLIPGETDKLEIVTDFPYDKVESTYQKISAFSESHSTDEIYQYGDIIVLREIYGLSDETIEDIRNSIQTLRNWRNPEKRRG